VVDRIADIWGPRTPHPAGSPWPVRVDQFLADGVAETEVDWVRSACVLCSNGCGMDLAVKDGRLVGVRGRAEDRVNHGRLGPKGLYGWQANNSADRLTEPLVRRDGRLQPASWDEAMDLVATRLAEIKARHGGNAFGFFSCSKATNEVNFLAQKFTRTMLSSNNIDSCNRT
jgi:ferredoxin-nitrate reductase